MQQFLTNQSIFFNKQTFYLLVVFFAVRIVSFFLVGQIFIQALLVFILLMLLGILYFKKPEWAWYLVLGEIFLAGSGHYLEFLGLSIRTLFIGFFMFLWLAQLVGQGNLKKAIGINNKLIYFLIALGIILVFSFFNGLHQGHLFRNVVGDLMPFSFLLLIFPAYYLFTDEKSQEYMVRLLIVFVLGTAIFSLYNFWLFAGGWAEIHGVYYQWFRDINLGKITDMGNNFFRIVEPEHILIVPVMLFIASLRMRAEKHNKMWRFFLLLCSIILALNLSRGYFLALGVGLLVLKYKHTWKKWFWESAITVLMVVVVFTGVSFLASGGQTFGLELFGLRIQSLTNPQIEVSTDTRMMILPVALEMIKNNALFGTGLGATVTFLNARTYQMITTTQFDWGYLEMWVELGLIGLVLLILVYGYAIYELIKKISAIPDWFDFDVGLLAGLVSFLIMNITIPALFHVFGILFLSMALVIGLKQTVIFERTTTVLYRIFNRIKT